MMSQVFRRFALLAFATLGLCQSAQAANEYRIKGINRYYCDYFNGSYYPAEKYVKESLPVSQDGGAIYFTDWWFSANETVSLTCKPLTGYYVSSWQLDADWGDYDPECPTGIPKNYYKYGQVNPVSITFDPKVLGNASEGEGRVLELVPHLKMMHYTLAYDKNGGEFSDAKPAAKDCLYGETIEAKGQICSRTGYALTGWNTASDGTGVSVDCGASFSGASFPVTQHGQVITLYAQWNANQYTATIAPGVGGSGGDSVNYTYSTAQQAKTITLPTHDAGHYISKWTASDYSGSAPSISENVLTIPAGTTGNFTMTPTWSAVQCTLTLSCAGHGMVSSFPTGSSHDYGKSITITATPETGYKFSHWLSTIEPTKIYESSYTFTIVGDVEFQAHFTTDQSYTITTASEPTAGGMVAGGGQYSSGTDISLTATANPGYSFQKWKDGNAENPRTITVTGDATYTAEFEANKYMVVFNATPGACSEFSRNVTYDSTYGADAPLPTPTRTGHNFGGWYLGDDLITDSTVVKITEMKFLVARWDEIPIVRHYVRFDGNGTTNDSEMAVQEFIGAETNALSANIYSKTDYTFIGWATNLDDAASCRVAYTNCQSVSFPDAKANETNVLYATWKISQYPLTLQLGTGIGEIKYSVTNSAWISALATTNVMVDAGATWKAYALANSGYTYNETSQSNPASGTMSASGAVFAPTATPKTIRVIYDKNGGTGGTTAESAFGYNQPSNLTSNGFERIYSIDFNAGFGDTPVFATSTSVWSFVKWNDQSNGKGTYSYGDGATVTNVCGSTGGTVTLYAQWTSNAASVVTFPGAPARSGYEFLGWGETVQEYPGQDPIPCWKPGALYVPSGKGDEPSTFYAYWKRDELSEAVGLTNAVLKAVADTEKKVSWMKRDMEATKKIDWDYGHETYVRLVNAGSSSATLDASSPLKLSVQLEGPGTFTYELYWNSGPTIRVIDICNGGLTTNDLATISSQAKWGAHTNELAAGQHEIVWLAAGDLASGTSHRIAVDNMTWTPDSPSPEPIIVKPGEELIYDTEEEATTAAKNAMWTRPNVAVEAVISEVDYRAMFDPVRAVPSKTSPGKWTLTADLTPAVSNVVQSAADAAASNLVAKLMLGESPLSITISMTAGLYYGIAATDTVEGLSGAEPKSWELGPGSGTLSVELPSGETGFFKVLARPEPPGE